MCYELEYKHSRLGASFDGQARFARGGGCVHCSRVVFRLVFRFSRIRNHDAQRATSRSSAGSRVTPTQAVTVTRAHETLSLINRSSSMKPPARSRPNLGSDDVRSPRSPSEPY